MTFERRFKLLILLNILISMCGFGLANQSLGLLVPALLLALTGWWMTEVRSQKGSWAGLPRWLTSVILVLMLLVAAVRAWLAEELVGGFTEFLAAVIVLKLWEKRAPRDYGQLITLSLFMTVGSTLTNAGAITGAVWIIQIPLLVAAVMMFQIYSAKDRAAELVSAWVPPPLSPAVEAGPVQRPAFIRLCVSVLLTGFIVAGAVFVFIPRGAGLDEWNMLNARQSRVAGFTEEVDLGAGSLISDSYTGVLEVSFTKGRRNLGASGTTFYLRGAVLESYAAGKWRESPNRVIATSTAQANQWTSLLPRDWASQQSEDEVIHQKISLLPGARDSVPLFALYKPIAVAVDSLAPVQVKFDRDSGWLQRETGRRFSNYEVRSQTPAPEPDLPERRKCAEFPSARVKTIAADILNAANIDPDADSRPLADDIRAVHAFESHLRSPMFSYTRDSQLKPPLGADATVWFLETRHEGHCEYFATALAALCRSVKINARVVAGYLVNEFDPERGVYIVRESDAHAWTEVDTGPGGWQVFDATPGSAYRPEQGNSFLDDLRRYSVRIDDWWVSNIVAFNQAQQDKLLSRFGGASLTDSAIDIYRKTVRSTRRFMRNLQSPVFAAAIVGGFALAASFTWVLVRAWKRRPRRKPNELGWAMKGPEKNVYKATLDLLAARGHAKPTWSPPLVHLRDVAIRDPDLAAQADTIMQLLYESRFGGNPARLSEARRLLSDLRSAN